MYYISNIFVYIKHVYERCFRICFTVFSYDSLFYIVVYNAFLSNVYVNKYNVYINENRLKRINEIWKTYALD